jgi:hypothetical protein
VVDETVRLNWVISGGNTCEGVRIQRADANQFYQTIGKIEGVCGAPDIDVPYVFIDDDPLENQSSFYRLELGTQGYSSSVAIDFVPLNNLGYSVHYDQIAKIATVYFDNTDNKPAYYNLISVSGNTILSSDTNASQIFLDLSGYAAQIFLLSIQIENQYLLVKIPAF